MFHLETMFAPPISRYWFEKTGAPDLLQIQQDRIVHNWRIGDGSVEYPRYEAVKSKFEDEIRQFSEWLAEENLGEIRVNQCEVNYTNLIDLKESDCVHADLAKLTPLWTDEISEQITAHLEDITSMSRFVFTIDEKPAGRLYVQFQPVYRQVDLQPMIKLEITARGKPATDKIEDALTFIDLERDHVVRTFAAVTTPEMHAAWGRIDGDRGD